MINRLITLLTFVTLCTFGNAQETPISQTEAKPSLSTEEAITIPLENIWSTEQKYFGGMDIPKTRQIAKLEGDPLGAGPLVNAIRREIGSKSRKEEADQAFVVEGRDIESLKNAHAVLVGKQLRPAALPKDSEISIVFFSLSSPYCTSLTNVERRGNTIEIRYELIPHMEDAFTSHFSLIPLGKLPPGHYQVAISRDPLGERYAKTRLRIREEFARGRVGTPFEFDVA